jgi:hypothetical protein
MDHVIKQIANAITPSLFQADELAPFDFQEHCLRKDRLIPEERLLLAILADAISCYQSYLLSEKPHERVLFEEAEQWISDDGAEFTSFRTVCETLKIDPAYVRRGLLSWKERRLERLPPVRKKRRWRNADYRQQSFRVAALRK